MGIGVNRRQHDDRFDNLFFSGMAVVILVSVFVGFAHSYYLAGVFKAPLPNLLVHIHGAMFSCWTLLLIVQTSLVAAGRVDMHRGLGLLGFALACLVVILGLLAATDSLGRHVASGEAGMRVRAFYTVTLSTMLAFATLKGKTLTGSSPVCIMCSLRLREGKLFGNQNRKHTRQAWAAKFTFSTVHALAFPPKALQADESVSLSLVI